MPGQARIVRSDVAAHTEAAAGQKNGERHYGEQSVHLLDPLLYAPPGVWFTVLLNISLIDTAETIRGSQTEYATSD
jgi:hypothetical protein